MHVPRCSFKPCCAVGELRSVLTDFVVGTSSRNVSSVRKITPVPSLPATAAHVTDKQLQVRDVMYSVVLVHALYMY